jgi:hypothetical protein
MGMCGYGRHGRRKNWVLSLQESGRLSSIVRVSKSDGRWMPRSEKWLGVFPSVLRPLVVSLTSFTGLDMSQNRCTRPQNSGRQCWSRGGSRKSGGGNIHEPERANQRRRGKRLSLQSRHSRFRSGSGSGPQRLAVAFFTIDLSIGLKMIWSSVSHGSPSHQTQLVQI